MSSAEAGKMTPELVDCKCSISNEVSLSPKDLATVSLFVYLFTVLFVFFLGLDRVGICA